MTRHHTCHALDCDTRVPPHLHMCGRHWRMVPKALQARLWANYVDGQETTMTPTAGYLRAAAACVRAVAEKEGLAPEAIDAECAQYETWADRLDAEAAGPTEPCTCGAGMCPECGEGGVDIGDGGPPRLL